MMLQSALLVTLGFCLGSIAETISRAISERDFDDCEESED